MIIQELKNLGFETDESITRYYKDEDYVKELSYIDNTEPDKLKRVCLYIRFLNESSNFFILQVELW